MVSRSSTADSVEAADWSARQAFFEAISQDIRRPLDGVLAVTELLQRQHLPADAQAYVRTIVEHHQRLLRALADAADLGRAELGGLEVSPQPTELRPMMDSIQAEWQAAAARSGVCLSVAYDGEDIAALVDAVRIQQLFNNLIDRALTVTRRGGVEASLHARREGGSLVIEGRVRDSGVALAPERLARIFEAGGSDGESGMAMVLCRRVAEALLGSIHAEANAGAGSTITFTFMADEAQFGAEPEVQHAARAAHVLVVDDNATNRMVAEALCEMFDCTSECAEDGVEAVEAARSGRFDLILMDIKMPRMDGVEATRTIRAMGGRAGMAPIIALTANADPEDAKGYIAAGMSCVVEKPIKPEALLAAMNACLPDVGETDQACAA